MNVKEFLEVCSWDDYVGFYNMDSDATKKRKSKQRFEKFPTEQTYMKICNIPYKRLRNILDKDILGISHTNKGYLVRFIDLKRLHKHIDNIDLAEKITRYAKESKE